MGGVTRRPDFMMPRPAALRHGPMPTPPGIDANPKVAGVNRPQFLRGDHRGLTIDKQTGELRPKRPAERRTSMKKGAILARARLRGYRGATAESLFRWDMQHGVGFFKGEKAATGGSSGRVYYRDKLGQFAHAPG